MMRFDLNSNFMMRFELGSPLSSSIYVVAVLIHTYKLGEVSNPLSVSLEAQI
jgi:hypothetical protein